MFSPRSLPVVTAQNHKHEVISEELSTFLVTQVTHQQLPKAKKIPKDHLFLVETIVASTIDKK